MCLCVWITGVSERMSGDVVVSFDVLPQSFFFSLTGAQSEYPFFIYAVCMRPLVYIREYLIT